MTSHPRQDNSPRDSVHNLTAQSGDPGLKELAERIAKRIERDTLVQKTTDALRGFLQVDRVVLYYFYRQWKGQVTFESLSSAQLSIYGSTGFDECFNDEYAAMYLAGRVRVIPDIELEPIADCHREFLRNLQVRANLVVPVLTTKGLWGLLVAHHCRNTRYWSDEEIEVMQKAAETLSTAPSIKDS